MMSWWRSQTTGRKRVLVGAFVLAAIVGFSLYRNDVDQAALASRMSASGIEAQAIPLQVTDKSHGALSQHEYIMDYSFVDSNNKTWQGSAKLTEDEFNQLFDPANPKLLKADARIPIIYDKNQPADNGPKRLFIKSPLEPNIFVSMSIAFLFVAIFLFLLPKVWSWLNSSKSPKNS